MRFQLALLFAWTNRYRMVAWVVDGEVWRFNDLGYRTLAEIFSRKPPSARYCVVESHDMFLCVDMWELRRNKDFSEFYLGEHTAHSTEDAAIMAAVLKDSTQP